MEKFYRTVAKPSVFVGLCVIIILVWIDWWTLLPQVIPTLPERGLLGDMFGGLNTLFTGLAFAGLVFTIALQKVDGIESDSDRKEQRVALAKQQFESSFFQMLNVLESIVAGTRFDSYAVREGEGLGRDAFRFFFAALDNNYLGQRNPHLEGLIGIARIKKGYDNFYFNYGHKLGHYFRTLYHIFKFVDGSKMSDEEKRFYSHFVRAQLSERQLLIMFYNGLSVYGEDKFKPLIEGYALFEQLPKAEIAAKDPSWLKFYDDKAYG